MTKKTNPQQYFKTFIFSLSPVSNFLHNFHYNNQPIMKLTKNQLKTWNSQQSQIDMFSKLQNNFLQKFFRLNLIDYFDDLLINTQEITPIKKINNKNTKSMLNHLFRVEKAFMIQEFQQKVHTFYKSKSPSFQSGEFQHAFKIRYCNWNPVPNLIRAGEYILFDIKIKAEIQKLENIPQKMLQLMGTISSQDRKHQDYDIIKKTFQNYNCEYFNFFIVYFGDINFHLVRKDNYQVQNIELFGKKFKLRIFTFFVSKQGLLQKFRTMNKINNLDHINDLVIQFYQMRRDKRRQKIKMQKEKEKEKQNGTLKKINKIDKIQNIYLEYLPYIKYVAGGVGVMAALCFATYKYSSVMH